MRSGRDRACRPSVAALGALDISRCAHRAPTPSSSSPPGRSRSTVRTSRSTTTSGSSATTTECLVVDAAHEAAPIVDAVGGRRVVAIVCTHGHNDHINAAVAVADAVGAPIALHPADLMLWEQVHSGARAGPADRRRRALRRRGTDARRAAHAGPLPRRRQPARRRRPRGLRGRHAVQGRTGRDRALVLRLPDDHRVDPDAPAHPPGGHGRVHRSRRHDDDRRRGPAPRRVDRPGPRGRPIRPGSQGPSLAMRSLAPHVQLTSLKFHG